MWQSTRRDWFLSVNHFAQSTPVLHTPMRLYAEYGVALFATVLLVAWWCARRDPNPHTMAAAMWAPAGALLALGLNQPLVNRSGIGTNLPRHRMGIAASWRRRHARHRHQHPC